MTTVTIRDVPDDVREALGQAADAQGQSLQAFLLGVLRQQAEFSHNVGLMVEVEADFAKHGGGAGEHAPDAGDLVRAARAAAGRDSRA